MKLLGIVKHLSQEAPGAGVAMPCARGAQTQGTSSGGSIARHTGRLRAQRILTQHRTRRPSPLRPQPDSAAPAPTPLRPSATPELTREIALLLHAWRCGSDECNVPNMRDAHGTRAASRRMQQHASRRARTSQHHALPSHAQSRPNSILVSQEADIMFLFSLACASSRVRDADGGVQVLQGVARAPARRRPQLRALLDLPHVDDDITRRAAALIRQIL